MGDRIEFLSEVDENTADRGIGKSRVEECRDCRSMWQETKLKWRYDYGKYKNQKGKNECVSRGVC